MRIRFFGFTICALRVALSARRITLIYMNTEMLASLYLVKPFSPERLPAAIHPAN
jgi:DNA-binding response OmpR family regulator